MFWEGKMKNRVLYYTGLMILLAAFMAACTAGKKQYDTGMQLSQAGKYEDQVFANGTWAEGDWSGDGEFDTGDMILAFQKGGYVA